MSAAPRPSEVIARVDDELRAIGSTPPAPGEMPKARASTMNLVVVSATPEGAESWLPVVDEVLLTLPARALVVGLDPDGADALEASATAVCAPGEGGGPVLCAERVHLVARGALCARLSSIVGALSISDVPTALVWLGRVHADDPAFAPLAAEAGRIVLDAAQGSLTGLAHVVYWARARPAADRPGVADLTWTRLAPWQELCARMFDEPRLRPLASHVSRVTLTQAGAAGAPLGPEATLLLGWLATRLGWRASSLAGKLRLVRPDDAQVVAQLRSEPSPAGGAGAAQALARDGLHALRIEAALDDLSMRGEVTREPGDADAATWRLEVTQAGETRRLEQHVRLRASEPARLLDRTLHRPVHDEALASAAAWADELRGEELACG